MSKSHQDLLRLISALHLLECAAPLFDFIQSHASFTLEKKKNLDLLIMVQFECPENIC